MADAHTLMVAAAVVFAAVIAWVFFARRGPKLPEAKGGAAGARTLAKGGPAADAKALTASTAAASASNARRSSAAADTIKTRVA